MVGYWGSDETGHNLRISIANVGRIPIYIRNVDVKSKSGDLLGVMQTANLDKNFITLDPNGIITQEITVCNINNIFDKYGSNLNGHIKIVVKDLEGKKVLFFQRMASWVISGLNI